MSKPKSDLLAVTAGEPAGIGPELCLGLARGSFADRVVVIADPDMLAERARILGSDVRIVEYEPGANLAPGDLRVVPERLETPATIGVPDPANARSLLNGLRRAIDGCLSGDFAAMITAPLQKSVINDAGIPFTGHTEFIAEATGCPRPVMLLVADSLRVALASTHLPLRKVPDYLTTELVKEVIGILNRDLVGRFGVDHPDIVVCGLNPHAGERGHLGREDTDVIAPAIEAARASGIGARGPFPADTAFTPAAGSPDAVLAMYHDQGLPVVKYAGFGHAVNVTLGLPIIRTSVDHGTALDLAGKGAADPGSLIAATQLAADLSG